MFSLRQDSTGNGLPLENACKVSVKVVGSTVQINKAQMHLNITKVDKKKTLCFFNKNNMQLPCMFEKKKKLMRNRQRGIRKVTEMIAYN